MKMNRTPWPTALLALAVAALAASAAEPAGGPGISGAKFDEALPAAAAQTQGAAFTTPLQSAAPRFREVAAGTEPGKLL